MDDYTLDRECTYKGVEYQVVEILSSDLLLVVKKEDVENEVFPAQCHIIPHVISR